MTAPYYSDESVTLYHGDFFDLMPWLPRVDHVLTDPPYSASTHKGARTRTVGAQSRPLVDFEEWDEASLRTAFEHFGRLARRWVVATMDVRHSTLLLHGPPPSLRFVRLGCWVKPNSAPQLTGDRPASGWESIAILHSTESRMRWNGGGRRGVWTANTIDAVDHPTAKPLTLFSEFVRLFSDPGETILDPFAGSGTTLRAAATEGRRAIGVELREDYCEIAAKRLSQGVLDFGDAS